MRFLNWIKTFFLPPWEYGTCNGRVARRHRRKGNVQFVLWKAGEMGYKNECWCNFDSSWYDEFKPLK